MNQPIPFVVSASGAGSAAPEGAVPINLYGASGGSSSVAWADVTGKPTTFAPVIGTTATTAAAGNHVHNAGAITATAVSGLTGTTVQAILNDIGVKLAALQSA